MKLTMVARPPSDRNLRLLKQLGVDHAVHYDMADLPDSREDILALRDRYAQYGLAWKIAESGPAIDRVVMGKDGAAEQTRRYARILGHLGAAGVEVVAYNFMPQVTEDAMVIRTAFDRKTRGDALTSGFRLADLRPDTIVHTEKPIERERMWSNLERFLKAVLPAAEAAGVRLAMHPDDPPLPLLCGLERIMGTVEDFDRLLAISPSESNALTLCFGCFAERGYDIPALIGHFGQRIAFVHVRDIRGTIDDFIETFPDDGQTDMLAAFGKLVEIGYDGYLRSDHAPQLAIDTTGTSDGYSLEGHIFAIGYLRGLDHAARRLAGR
ncbi:MAG: mannonate dehydratase [Devosia sp.]|nr:mannonate dehydratase [Devosia sp.]